MNAVLNFHTQGRWEKEGWVQDGICYPTTDENPMPEGTLQAKWSTFLFIVLELLFQSAHRIAVFRDIYWYPVLGKPKLCQAPDVMVVCGRPKGVRESYLQWLEKDVAPQFVVEIISQSNTPPRMKRKRAFYSLFGVEEYIEYDPYQNTVAIWERVGTKLKKLPKSRVSRWVSPRLGIRLGTGEEGLILYGPNGERLKDHFELERAGRETAEERDTIKTKLNITQTERDTFKTERDTIKTERDTIKTERDTFKTERDTFKTERDIAQSELAAALARIAELEAQSAGKKHPKKNNG